MIHNTSHNIYQIPQYVQTDRKGAKFTHLGNPVLGLNMQNINIQMIERMNTFYKMKGLEQNTST